MLSAHADEIGIVVTHIDEKGFLRGSPMWAAACGNVGGQPCPVCQRPDRRRIQGKGALKDLGPDKLYIDIGAESEEGARKW